MNDVRLYEKKKNNLSLMVSKLSPIGSDGRRMISHKDIVDGYQEESI